MALQTNISLAVVAALTGTSDLQTVKAQLNYSKGLQLTSGTGANQADLIFSDTRTIAASGSEELDLAGGLTDALGNTLTFACIKTVFVYAAPGNTNNVVVGGAASNAFVGWFGDATDTEDARPGGIIFHHAPDATAYAVTAGTGDLLKVANSSSGTGVTYDIVIIGASA